MICQQLAIVIMALALGGLLGGYLTLILLRDEDEGNVPDFLDGNLGPGRRLQ